MSQFIITELAGQTAVKFNHNMGPFDIFMLRESEESDKIKFFCPTRTTPFLMKSAERRAILSLLKFGSRLGYHRSEDISFDDVLHILGTAKDVVARNASNYYKSSPRYFWE